MNAGFLLFLPRCHAASVSHGMSLGWQGIEAAWNVIGAACYWDGMALGGMALEQHDIMPCRPSAIQYLATPVPCHPNAIPCRPNALPPSAMPSKCYTMPPNLNAMPSQYHAVPITSHALGAALDGMPHAIQIHCRPVVCRQCNWQNLALPDFLYFQAMCFAATVSAEFLIFSLRSFAASVIAGIWNCQISKCLGECRMCVIFKQGVLPPV